RFVVAFSLLHMRVHVCLGYYYTFLWKSRICFLEPFPQHCFHLYNDIAIRLADIIPFTGILFEIEEFRFPRLVMIDEFHISLAHGPLEYAVGIMPEQCVPVDGTGFFQQNRLETPSIDMLFGTERKSTKVKQGRIEVVGDQRPIAARSRPDFAGPPDNQGHAYSTFIQVVLCAP